MTNTEVAPRALWLTKLRELFVARDFGRGLLGSGGSWRMRAVLAAAAAMTLGFPATMAQASDGTRIAGVPAATVAEAPVVVAGHRAMPGMGGPYESATSTDAGADRNADAQYRTLFLTWKKLDTIDQAVISVPSAQPIQGLGASQMLSFSSTFGIRTDPFRGTAAMHAGVDIPGPIGTPVYATADGFVDRAERSGGYGNLIELDHGKGIQTRYGHLSRILVEPGTRVTRGQLIALMGSTGRSTGSHLHYEVRIDGHAVNPMPFLQTADYLLAVQDRALKAQQVATIAAVGGPAVAD